MFLVVDANILFSFFKEDSSARKLIRRLPKLGFKLISPDFALEELLRDEERVEKYGEISELEFIFLLSLLEKKIEIFSRSEYEGLIPEAKKLLIEHTKDAPYLVLALKLGCAIWSNEKRLKHQSRVRILSTSELFERLSKTKP